LSYRSDAVRAALNEWKAHPAGRPDLYWREVLRPEDLPFEGNWCGAFVLRSLKKAGLGKDVPWITSFGFIAPQKLPTTDRPLPGDIVYIHEPFQHQAMVISYEPTTGMLTSIDGNVPGIAPKVRFKTGNLQFYSIQPLIDAAEAASSPWGFVLAGAALLGAGAWIWLNGVPAPLERQLKRLGL
jgi:hypothetical protein